jgi:hypothetical protein
MLGYALRVEFPNGLDGHETVPLNPTGAIHSPSLASIKANAEGALRVLDRLKAGESLVLTVEHRDTLPGDLGLLPHPRNRLKSLSGGRVEMRQEIREDHRTDEHGNPTGGFTLGTGIDLKWQDGPLGRDGDRQVPNGAFVEGVIQAAIGRLEFYEHAAGGKFSCVENLAAIDHLHQALAELEDRTAKREARGVEGTHTP